MEDVLADEAMPPRTRTQDGRGDQPRALCGRPRGYVAGDERQGGGNTAADGGRAGGRADVRVEEMSGRQGVVTGLAEELCEWGNLGSWGQRRRGSRVPAAMTCQGRLRHTVRVRVKSHPKQ